MTDESAMIGEDKRCCDVCWRTDRAMHVVSSGLGPISFLFCEECLSQNAEPVSMFQFVYATCGTDVAEHVKAMRTYIDGRYYTWQEWVDEIRSKWIELTPEVLKEIHQLIDYNRLQEDGCQHIVLTDERPFPTYRPDDMKKPEECRYHSVSVEYTEAGALVHSPTFLSPDEALLLPRKD